MVLHADLEYVLFGGRIIEQVLRAYQKHQIAKDRVNEKLRGYALCTVRIHQSDIGLCRVHLEEFGWTGYCLEQALREYFSIAGTPDFIRNGSDVVICDKVLAVYGQTTQRSLKRFMQGRWVVDKKEEPMRPIFF